MADSNITKRVLALTLEKLVQTESFEKINVREICEACGVSRKTFYYHFQDKYALVEWIFNSEFTAALNQSQADDRWGFITTMCEYFYRERTFYAKLLEVTGQNSFRQYFQGFMFQAVDPFLLPESTRAITIPGCHGQEMEEIQDFYAHFISDAVLVSVFRWLTGGAKLPPDQFVSRLKGVADMLVIRAVSQYGQDDLEATPTE